MRRFLPSNSFFDRTNRVRPLPPSAISNTITEAIPIFDSVLVPNLDDPVDAVVEQVLPRLTKLNYNQYRQLVNISILKIFRVSFNSFQPILQGLSSYIEYNNYLQYEINNPVYDNMERRELLDDFVNISAHAYILNPF